MRTVETTIKVIKRNGQYLCSFPYNSKIVQEITPEHITHYISCIAESGVYSSSYQNSAVHAIKFYIETVCGHKMPTIALIYSAGLRVSETVSLRITDLEFDRGLIRIVQGKGKKDRIVPFSERLYAMIQEYWKKGPICELSRNCSVTVAVKQQRFILMCRLDLFQKYEARLMNWR